MEGLFRDAERPLSEWNLDSDRRSFLGSIREVGVIASPLEADQSQLLQDPPLQLDDIKNIQEGKDVSATDDIDLDIVDKEDLQELRRVAMPSSSGPEARKRVAPPRSMLRQDANTIEIVKKDGMYSVVMDGVSMGVIQKDESTGEYKQTRYWMPRFKEKAKVFKQGVKRTVQPVMFAMRLEEYESAPRKCTLNVIQKVVNDGTVTMPWSRAKQEEIVPYSVGDASVTVGVVPYPMICTPEPTVAVNDYSKMREAEILLALSADESLFTATLTFLSRSLGQVTPFSGETGMGWKDFVNWGVALKRAAKAAALAAAPGSAAAGAAGAGLVTSGLAGLGTFLAWQYLASTNKVADWKITEEDRKRLFGVHEAECSKDPPQYRFTLTELADSLFRIAETRANGSLVDGSDRTIGYAVHDLVDKKWRRDAALLQWLQYGEMTRPVSDATRADPVTGRYSTRQNVEQNQALRTAPLAAGVTGNTVSLAGVDPVSVCNTRTEFAFEITIEEKDGTMGPTIVIESTRTNGVDAGWVAAGYDEKLDTCRRVADYLEVKLVSMPGVAHWIRGHSTLVADTNNGVIVGDKFDMDLNAMLGRLVGDTSGPANTDEKVRKAREREAAKEKIASSKRKRAEASLASKNKGVLSDEKKLEDAAKAYDKKLLDNEKDSQLKVKDAEKESEKKRRDILADAALTDDRRQAKLDALDESLRNKYESLDRALAIKQANARKAYDSSKERLEASVLKKRSKAVEADENLLKATREERVRQIRTKAAGKRRSFANIIDYKAFMTRLRGVLLGDEYDTFDASDAETDRERIRRENLAQRSFWRKVTLQPSREEPLVKLHSASSMEALTKSLSIPTSTLDYNNVMFIRFMHAHTPASKAKNVQAMRLAAFVVPSNRHWDVYDHGYELVRTMPQFFVFSRSLISTFGKVSMLQPLSLEKSLLENQPLAISSVASARAATTRISNLVDIEELYVWKGRCHFSQQYRKDSGWAHASGIAFSTVLPADLGLMNMASSSFIPTPRIMRLLDGALEAGGVSYASTERLVSGKNLEGTANILRQVGATRTQGGVIAMEVFAEILTLYMLRSGTSPDEDFGFQIQKDELVFSSMHRARQSCIAIANFMGKHYVSRNKAIQKIPFNDVAFYCVPGMLYLKVALRALGVYKEYDDAKMVNASISDDFVKSLLKIASSSSTPFRVLPFTCVQSVIKSLPAAIQTWSEDQGSVMANIRALVNSFDRIVAMTRVFEKSGRPFLSVRVDCICSRPIFLKAVYCNPEVMGSVVASTSAFGSQNHWKVPGPRLGTNALRHRLARLRINVSPEARHQAATTQLSYGTSKENMQAYHQLVNSMLNLDIRKLDYISPSLESMSATYVVPLGLFASGTPSDISHMQFETHPVWVDKLYETLEIVRIDSSVRAHPQRNLVVADGEVVNGRPRNPFAIEYSNNTVSVFLDNVNDPDDVPGSVGVSILSDSASASSIMGLSKEINKTPGVAEQSGRLSHVYRATMHNTERIFQAALLVASRAHHDVDKDSTITVRDPVNTHVGLLAACACVGSAMAAVETGLDTRAFVLESSSTEAHHKAVEQAVLVLEEMCDSLRERGFKAVPFAELCMCMCLL